MCVLRHNGPSNRFRAHGDVLAGGYNNYSLSWRDEILKTVNSLNRPDRTFLPMIAECVIDTISARVRLIST